MNNKEKLDILLKKRAKTYLGGGKEKIEKRHESGRLTARERLALLFDPGTFQEHGLFMHHRCTNFGLGDKEFPGEGVVAGMGSVADRVVYSASQDFTVAGGSVGEFTAKKDHRCYGSGFKKQATHSSSLMTQVVQGFRRVLTLYQDMATYSTETYLCPVLYHR